MNPVGNRTILNKDQLNLFNLNTLNALRLREYTPQSLKKYESKKVLSIDIGGDKIISAIFVVKNGKLNKLQNRKIYHSTMGIGYIDFLEEESKFANKNFLPVGISSAGTVINNKLLKTANMPEFANKLRSNYNSSFANLFSKKLFKSVENDAVAGLIACINLSNTQKHKNENIIFLINGSGVGGAIYTNNSIWSLHPGHVQISKVFNPFNLKDSCHIEKNKYVCIEKVAASKAGIENIYYQKTGVNLNGYSISQKALSGDKLALKLYDNSARIMMHVILGIVKSFNILNKRITVVCHGGCFEGEEYKEKVIKYTKEYNRNINFLFTKNFSENICLEGAALAALNNII